MPESDNPRVRWVEVVPTVHDGREAFIVRDPEGLTDQALLVSRDVLFLLSLMDGSRSIADIQAEYMRASGVLMDTDRIMSVVQTMDDHFLLSNSRYEDYITSLRNEYESLPFRNAFLRGRSYPDSREELHAFMRTMMGRASEEDPKGNIKGMIAPHIDYERGKDVYAPTYRNLVFRDGTLFVIFGTCHKFAPRLWNISLKDLETPLGRMRTAAHIGTLIKQDAVLSRYVDEWPHRNEHSIELQIPIIQYLMREREYQVLPILTGSLHEYIADDGQSLEDGETRHLIEHLEGILQAHPGPCVFVAAADLAHIGAQFGDPSPLDSPTLEQSRRKDEELLRTIEAGDAVGFFNTVKREGDRRRICGLTPVYFTLAMLKGIQGRLAGYQQWTDGASSVSFAGAIFMD
jgi:MEMO1 family protein